MKLWVNGKEEQLEIETVAQLIEKYELNKEFLVAEVDGEILDASQWESFQLYDGAKIELVHFVGGG